jgi:hypothetical protein
MQALAQKEACPLAWQQVIVSGVAHEFDRMASAAVVHWRLPVLTEQRD